VVLKLQNRVRGAVADDMQIVIYGKLGHAEVNGLVGQTQGKAIVIKNQYVQVLDLATERAARLEATSGIILNNYRQRAVEKAREAGVTTVSEPHRAV
jgi:4-hydroxy-3-methylbut-2-enyl diphosphate reductase IspH